MILLPRTHQEMWSCLPTNPTGRQRALIPLCRIHRDFGPLGIFKTVGSSEQSTLSHSVMWIFVWTIYPSPFKSCPSSFGHLNTYMSACCAASSVHSVSDLKEGKTTAFFKDVLTVSFCHCLLISPHWFHNAKNVCSYPERKEVEVNIMPRIRLCLEIAENFWYVEKTVWFRNNLNKNGQCWKIQISIESFFQVFDTKLMWFFSLVCIDFIHAVISLKYWSGYLYCFYSNISIL